MEAETIHKRLLVFVPEGNRASGEVSVDLQDRWVVQLLQLCADLCGGATAYGRGVGVWKQGEGASARIYWDRVTVIESWIDPFQQVLDQHMTTLGQELNKMRSELKQEAVLCILSGTHYVLRDCPAAHRRE